MLPHLRINLRRASERPGFAGFVAALHVACGLCRQAVGQIEERHQVECVVIEDGIHLTFEASPNIVRISGGDGVPGNIAFPKPPANVPFERLQAAVWQLPFPAPAGVVKDIDMDFGPLRVTYVWHTASDFSG